MDLDLLPLFGGIGLFLFGMQVMTGALRQLASGHVRAILARFTTSPFTGAVTGALTTAAIQSSSATMVTVIGFVGAGLMSFPQAIGVVYGANIGTTVTGWIVALLGLKLSLGALALPLLLAGTLASTLARGWPARTGRALAGFSLVFIGLDMMQEAAAGFEGWLTPDLLPGDTLVGRALLLLAGALVTLVIQSSSAGVAAALVLLSTGAITLGQGAALVIGMDVGTTFTSVLATIGGSRDMRRTAMAHVAYNIVTGIAAFALLGVAVPALEAAFGAGRPEALVAFHTLFNLVGVVLMLPVTAPFARMIERLVPGEGAPLTEALDRRFLSDPGAAMDGAEASARAILQAHFAALGRYLSPHPGPLPATETARLHPALDDLHDFLARIRIPEDQAAAMARYSALLHLYDHLHRLSGQMRSSEEMQALVHDPGLLRPARAFGAALRRAAAGNPAADHARLERLERLISGRTHKLRRSALLREHAGLVGLSEVFELTDSMRWLERTAHNAARCVHYAGLAADLPVRREAAAP